MYSQEKVHLADLLKKQKKVLAEARELKREIKKIKKLLLAEGQDLPGIPGRKLKVDVGLLKLNRKLYALECEGGYYYVGQSINVYARFIQHRDTLMGAWFTRNHKPIRVLEVRELGKVTEAEALDHETDMAYEYITRYGIEKVRGGRFIQHDPKHFKRLFKKYENVPPQAIAAIQALDDEMMARIAREP